MVVHQETPVASSPRPALGAAEKRPRVAYIMSRFPKLTETFILYEILAMEKLGVAVEIFPLLREPEPVMHPEAAAVVKRANFQPFVNWPIVKANLGFALRKPGTYFGTLWDVLRGTAPSLNFFVGALGIFPKAVRAASMMAESGVEHVHAHFATHPALAGFIIHRLVGIPYSFTAHGSDLHVDRTMLREKVAEAAFVVSISNYNRELIVEDCGEQFRAKVKVIHCGVDTTVFTPVAGTKSGAALSLLCIGTLHEVKGQTYLIEACRLLRERGVDVICRFVGEGEDRAALQAQIDQAGLGERVQLLGRRTREQIAALMAETDIVVTPSVPTKGGKREGIPVVLMEAMASGAAVVASGISGIPELVANELEGLLVPPRDAAALTDALQRLAGDPALRRRLGQAGREKVLREFDLALNAAELASEFKRG